MRNAVKWFIASLCVFMLPWTALAVAPDGPAKDFLQSKRILAQLYFQPSSAQLSATAKEKIAQTIKVIKKSNGQETFFRIEGFSSMDGDKLDNINLSTQRALTVKSFIDEHFNLSVDLYLTTFGAVKDVQGDGALARRVDIVSYKTMAPEISLFENSEPVERIILK